MSRRMSCAITVDAVRARTKTETRRHVGSWRTLTAGDRLTLIEKGMGLKKGDRQVKLADVVVTGVRVEPLSAMTEEACTAEGFPGWTVERFAAMWLSSHGYIPRALPKKDQVKLAGNAVTPPVMAWIVGRILQALEAAS